MLLGSSHVGFLNRDNGQTTQQTEQNLGFCPAKKAGCSQPYISINYRLHGSNEYLNRLMEDQKEFD